MSSLNSILPRTVFANRRGDIPIKALNIFEK